MTSWFLTSVALTSDDDGGRPGCAVILEVRDIVLVICFGAAAAAAAGGRAVRAGAAGAG